MPQNAFFLCTHDLLVSQKMTQRHFFSTLHPLSTVIFATATVLAFVLLRNSRFNFHCYTQCEAMPTQKSAQKYTVTSRNFLHERLQSAFTLANQLRWIAQYSQCTTLADHPHTQTTVQIMCLCPKSEAKVKVVAPWQTAYCSNPMHLLYAKKSWSGRQKSF